MLLWKKGTDFSDVKRDQRFVRMPDGRKTFFLAMWCRATGYGHGSEVRNIKPQIEDPSIT